MLILSVERNYRDRGWFYRQYVDQNRSLTEMAENLGVAVSTLSRWRDRHEIKKTSQKVRLECPVCGTTFRRYQNRIERAKHRNVCSRDCLYEARREGLLDWVDRIITGDARAMDRIPDGAVDLVFTSPPYNVGVDYDGYDDTKSIDEYREFLRDVLAECVRVLRPQGGRLCLTIAGMEQGRDHVPANKLVMEEAEEVGLRLRRELIWDKSVSAGRSPMYGSFQSASCPAFYETHESLLVFYAGEFKRPDSGPDTIEKEEFIQATDSVWRLPASSYSDHPSPFPVDLARRATELLSYQGDVVLDPFIGSGTTAIAAAQSGRHYVGYEISEQYSDIARARLNSVDAEQGVNRGH